MAAPCAHRAREPKLRVGDTVPVAVRHFGEAYAKSLYGRSWQSDEHRDVGTVVGRAEDRWLVDFNDEGEVIAWERFKLRFVSRPEAAPGVVLEDESDDEQVVEEKQPAAGAELQTASTEVTSARGARGGAGKGGGGGRGRGRGSAGRGRGQANNPKPANESSDEDSEAIDSEQEEGSAE
eukprot:6205053-Pleurochrysis_carterae.AAC.1